jgi:hypothetical protein
MTVESSFPGQPSRILLAPDQRLPNDVVFIGANEMPQEPFGYLLVNERGKHTALRTPPSVQLDHMIPMINAALKRWRIPQILLRQIHVTPSVQLGRLPSSL